MTAVAPNVLIAENDNVSRLFHDNLEADGYRPVCAAVTAAALGLLSATLDALIVDVNGDTLVPSQSPGSAVARSGSASSHQTHRASAHGS